MCFSVDDIRQKFINYFQKKEHQLISSSSLVPDNDHTLLFTNAGMNQFKDIFLGIERPSYKRVVTVQSCMRAGGKHNDLDHVGYTERHLTFFEMLGNFSFGDYFKTDAIQFAWELLTHKDWFNLSKDKIWVTTHVHDTESYNIWKKYIGLSSQRIITIGDKTTSFCNSDNFWQMGNVGPCGPCSEIFYDRGCSIQGTPPNNIKFFGERYVEIWNLVFIQFNRQVNGNFEELPMLSVDTGMGLERITSIIQKVSSNYLIDIFQKLIVSISKTVRIDFDLTNRSWYVIADHIRSCVFLIKDGVVPSNEGRGYVLRRIIRRAIYHGKKIGVNSIFLYKLVNPLIMCMQYFSNELNSRKELIEQVLFNEEKLFENTLKNGLELLEIELDRLKSNNILNGDIVFRLYNTYGFPLELTKDICRERDIQVDQITFDQLMSKEKQSSKKINQSCAIFNSIFPLNEISTFIGYQNFSSTSKIIALLKDNKTVDTIHVNQKGIVILNITPFYGESGGQIGDIGCLKTDNSVFKVIKTAKHGQTIAHEGFLLKGVMSIRDEVVAEIDQLRRNRVSLNHTATHLLHAALLQVLGPHIIQQGSLVHHKYLRFDFSHHDFLTEVQISMIENFINRQIWNNLSVVEDFVTIEYAQNCGFKMLLHKQYNQMVRLLRIGDVSAELCGGTHVQCTGEIGLFIITKEIGIGSGIRRIEAVTKDTALSVIQHKKYLIRNIAQMLYSDDSIILNKIHHLKLDHNQLQKEVIFLKNKCEFQNIFNVKNILYIKKIPVLIKKVSIIETKSLFYIIGNLKSCLKSGIIVLINIKNNNICHIVISITQDIIKTYCVNSLDLIHHMIDSFGGKGGGKCDFAQARINKVLTESEVFIGIRTLF